MSIYVLIHGAWYGAWCWRKVTPLLEKKGHTVIVPDMPAHGEDQTPINEITLDSYADKVCSVVNDQAGQVILVGHSFGGISITQAAEYCPDNIKCLVYVAAFLLPNGTSRRMFAPDDRETLVTPNLVYSQDRLSATIKDDMIREAFYHDCCDEDYTWALPRIRPEPTKPIGTPLQTTSERFGRIPRYYIETLEDKALLPMLQKRMYSDLPCREVYSMHTSHSPFLTAPDELANHLITIGSLID
jgi:pimeloyl-ACP methyl ester carboxylesterase